MMTARCSIGAALLAIACGGSVDGDRNGTSRAGNAGASGDRSADAGSRGGTGGTTSGGTAGMVQGGAGATFPVGGGGFVTATGGFTGAGGILAAGGLPIAGGASSSGAAPGTGGDTCGPGGCIQPIDVPPIAPPGPVFCGGVECAAPRACCMTTSTCYDPVSAPETCPLPPPDNDMYGRTACASNAQCQPGWFCERDSRVSCAGIGHCNPIGNCGNCGGCRLCGCDGNTYPDQATACLASANFVTTEAGCGETIVTTGTGVNAGSTRYATPCGKNQDCASGELCCMITRYCYPASDPDRCRTPPPGTQFPCTADDQCGFFYYCLGDGCSGPGGCVPFGPQADCGVTLEPVCGCDGKSYTSAPCAAYRGVRVASQGECPAPN
jgi:hypothetical protein